MRRWRVSSTSAVAAWSGAALWVAGIALGLASERTKFRWSDFSDWMPDLVVGLVFIGCGAQSRPRDRGTAVLMLAIGCSWFTANFWADGSFVHRGLIAHVLITYPGWRPRSTIDRLAIAAYYTAAFVLPVWRNEVLAIVLGVALVAIVARASLTSPSRLRRARMPAVAATTVFSAVIVGESVLRDSLGVASSAAALTLVYQAALCVVALIVTVTLQARDSSTVIDLVVELGDAPSGTLRDSLAISLDDPTLEVGYWDQRAGDQRARYIDAEGRGVDLPEPGGPRTATFVARDERPFAVLVHDTALLAEPALIESVAAATRLSTAHRQLQAVVGDQLAQLSASRRRLVTAADEERRRLDDRLRSGAERCLHELDDLLQQASGDETSVPLRVQRAQLLLAQTVEDLHQLAAGLHPRDLSLGLAGALQSLTNRSPLPTDLSVDGDDVADEIKTAIFYVCAEALANAIKHADAASMTIRVMAATDLVRVVVTDDGCGGADVDRGTGLRGLIDRVEALGGTLRIEGPPAGGTRLTVEFAHSGSTEAPCGP